MANSVASPLPGYERRRHDHLVLRQDNAVRWSLRTSVSSAACACISVHRTPRVVELPRVQHTIPAVHSRGHREIPATPPAYAAIKAVLLMQEHFPGVGNWMADEILWRAGSASLPPSAGSLDDSRTQRPLGQRCVGSAAPPSASSATIGPTRQLGSSPTVGKRAADCPRCRAVTPSVRPSAGRTTCWCPVLPAITGYRQ